MSTYFQGFYEFYTNVKHYESSTMHQTTNVTKASVPRIFIPLSIQSLLLLICFVCSTILWLESLCLNDYSSLKKSFKIVANMFAYYESYHTDKLPANLKYILLWTSPRYSPFQFLGKGQTFFIKNNCSVINCYVTSEKTFFGGDVTKFDIVAFNGRNLYDLNYPTIDLPEQRSPHQIYLFVMTESSDKYPICEKVYDNLFNWTFTYRLSSTIVINHILIFNQKGEVIGPKQNMEWVDMNNVEDDLPNVRNKSRAVAWFVSNCVSRSHRFSFVNKLQRMLSLYGLTVDIYGACGRLRCPKERSSKCLKMLEKDYFFYLALENSFDEDYVTEKVLTAINHDVVPIVYGGANYTRFLPPHSYLDARRLSAKQLAANINEAVTSKKVYQRFFWWKRYYSYVSSYSHSICSLCSALHNSSQVNARSSYKQFRLYWNPNYKKRCEEQTNMRNGLK